MIKTICLTCISSLLFFLFSSSSAFAIKLTIANQTNFVIYPYSLDKRAKWPKYISPQTSRSLSLSSEIKFSLYALNHLNKLCVCKTGSKKGYCHAKVPFIECRVHKAHHQMRVFVSGDIT